MEIAPDGPTIRSIAASSSRSTSANDSGRAVAAAAADGIEADSGMGSLVLDVSISSETLADVGQRDK